MSLLQIRKHVEFVFISAPHVIPDPVNLSRPEDQQERGWWFSRPEKAYNALDCTDVLLGYEETVHSVCEAFQTQGPFDGVLGFSQGASLVSLLCILRTDPSNPIEFKFAILVAGFKSLISPHFELYRELIDCPSFHTIGESDAVIPSQSSEELLGAFENAVAYRHSGGHYVPASPQLRTAMLDFLKPYIQQ